MMNRRQLFFMGAAGIAPISAPDLPASAATPDPFGSGKSLLAECNEGLEVIEYREDMSRFLRDGQRQISDRDWDIISAETRFGMYYSATGKFENSCVPSGYPGAGSRFKSIVGGGECAEGEPPVTDGSETLELAVAVFRKAWSEFRKKYPGGKILWREWPTPDFRGYGKWYVSARVLILP